jgi:squalene-hopene/tetraprenyl-beta-curcumene cyclase
MTMKRQVLGLLVVALAAGWVLAADDAAAPKGVIEPTTTALSAAVVKMAQMDINDGIANLLKQQNAEGGWGFDPKKSYPALTAMVVKVLLQHPDYKFDTPVVAKGLDVLMKFRQADGGFYDAASPASDPNYNTCIAVMTLALVKDKDPKYKEALDSAVKYLRGMQIVAGTKAPAAESKPAIDITPDNPYVGGVSYGRHGRPDLSNESYWLQAMEEAGVSGDDAQVQAALKFVKRLQNRTEGTEGQTFVVKGTNDDGFIYAINWRDNKFVGESPAGDSADQGLRSYGSMTYAGFKAMLYAKVAKDDPRVKGAFDWIRKNWQLDVNPNMPDKMSKQGLFYFYHIFAKALRAYGDDEIADAKGVKHNWRGELIEMLHGLKKDDGSWKNSDARWLEESPPLATIFSVLALEETLKK